MSGSKQHTMAVLGGGRLAEAIGAILGDRIPVRLWTRSEEERQALRDRLPKVQITSELGAAVDGASLVFLAVPAPAMLEVAERYGEHARGNHMVLSASRGVGEGFMLPHQMIRARTCVRKIGVFGGPLHTRELALGRPLSAVLASRFSETTAAVQQIVAGGPLTIHPSKDVVGVEVAGAISNVSALAAGMADALDMGETARGILLTHGLVEARRLGTALGGEAETFGGLAGVGDLIPRRVTSTDRHHEVARRLVETGSLDEALRDVRGHVEGLITLREAAAKGSALALDLPLIYALDGIVVGKEKPKEALEGVLRRPIDL